MRTAILVLLCCGSGCVIGNNKYPKPKDLTPAWLVDRPRVLGISADPPEVSPGEVTSLSSLVVGVDEEDPPYVVWLGCPPADPGEIEFGCAVDLADVDLANATPEELVELGFIGFEPIWPPSYTAPLDSLDGIEEERDRREGVQAMMQIAVMPPEADLEADVDFEDVEVAYKRLVISEASTPNHNPAVEAFTVDGWTVTPGTVIEVDPEQSYDLGIVLSETAIETYEYFNREGEVEDREEEPYASWYATDGTVVEPWTLVPYLDSTWTAPDGSGVEGKWWAVVRDRRGGLDWIEVAWRTR